MISPGLRGDAQNAKPSLLSRTRSRKTKSPSSVRDPRWSQKTRHPLARRCLIGSLRAIPVHLVLKPFQFTNQHSREGLTEPPRDTTLMKFCDSTIVTGKLRRRTRILSMNTNLFRKRPESSVRPMKRISTVIRFWFPIRCCLRKQFPRSPGGDKVTRHN